MMMIRLSVYFGSSLPVIQLELEFEYRDYSESGLIMMPVNITSSCKLEFSNLTLVAS
jgi:hypothetical protein